MNSDPSFESERFEDILVLPREPHAEAEISVDGSKHSFAHMLAAAALADSGVMLNVADTIDSRALISCLDLMFNTVSFLPDKQTLTFSDPKTNVAATITDELARNSRSLFCLLPALLHHCRQVRLEQTPLGCSLGNRPHDLYLAILEAFGVRISRGTSAMMFRWEQRHSAEITMQIPSMTGTVIAFAAACVAEGDSVISGGSVEPSCFDELKLCRQLGATVDESEGTVRISSPADVAPVRVNVPPDRIHAVTYLTAAALHGTGLIVRGSGAFRVPKFVAFCRSLGLEIFEEDSSVRLLPSRNIELNDVSELQAGAEPLFSSDWLPFACLLIAVRCRGETQFADQVFSERLQFLRQLNTTSQKWLRTLEPDGRSKARIELMANRQIEFTGGKFKLVPDIRGGAAQVLAATLPKDPGASVQLTNSRHIMRGYSDLPRDLSFLGLDVAFADSTRAQLER